MTIIKVFVLIAILSLSYSKSNFMQNLPLLDGNLASWDSIGGWKPNSAVYITNNACSNWTKYLGNVWNNLKKSFKIPITGCPIPAGANYLTTGVDSEELEDVNLPKVYFYGKSKLTGKIKNRENKVLGRIILELTLVRPWEKPIWLN